MSDLVAASAVVRTVDGVITELRQLLYRDIEHAATEVSDAARSGHLKTVSRSFQDVSHDASLSTRAAHSPRYVLRCAEDIIAALLDVPRFWPSQHGADVLDDSVYESALAAVARLKQGAPFAYAVRRASFRHLTLDVDERVLIPRPETELIVDEIFRLLPTKMGVAIDIGTGSGAIALALASEGAFSRVVATDVSLDALAVAQHNATLLKTALRTPIEFRHGSLLAPVADVRADVIVSNPPYIAYNERLALPPSVRDWEPSLALLSGENGMAATVAIVCDAATLLRPDGLLVLEVDTRRAALVAERLAVDSRYCDVAVRLDLTGRERFVVARRAP